MLQENFFLGKRGSRTRHQPQLTPWECSEQGEAFPPEERGKTPTQPQPNPKPTEPCRSCKQRHFWAIISTIFLEDKELSLGELGVHGELQLCMGQGRKCSAGHGAAPALARGCGHSGNWGWHSTFTSLSAASGARAAHPCLPAREGIGSAAPAPAPSSPPFPSRLQPNPARQPRDHPQAAPELPPSSPGTIPGRSTHLSKNPSANIVNRMENLRRTVNMGRLQEEGAAA